MRTRAFTLIELLVVVTIPPPADLRLRLRRVAGRHDGFTLIELLVVVTIIAVLLAMLTPALDKAVYQAELVRCAAQLRGVGGAAFTYAMDARRSYPYRVGARNRDWSEANLLKDANPTSPGSDWDERPVLRLAMNLRWLVCPLTGRIDPDHDEIDTLLVYSTYNLRFDFGFIGESRMARIGDRWTFANDKGEHAWSIIAHDFSTTSLDLPASWGTHPDADGVLKNTVLQDQLVGLTAPIKATGSRWDASVKERGTVDLNYAYEDGSVYRLDRVGWDDRRDERVTAVPEYDAGTTSDKWPNWRCLMPMR